MSKTFEWMDCHVWTTGEDTVIAKSRDDAIEVWNDHTGEDWLADYVDVAEWRLVPDDDTLTIHFDILDLDLVSVPASATRKDQNGRAYFDAKCKAWVRCYGRGFLCSVDW